MTFFNDNCRDNITLLRLFAKFFKILCGRVGWTHYAAGDSLLQLHLQLQKYLFFPVTAITHKGKNFCYTAFFCSESHGKILSVCQSEGIKQAQGTH